MAKSVSKSEVIDVLQSEDYDKAAKLGDSAFRHLKAIVAKEHDDWSLATKAIYAASLIGGEKAAEIVMMGSMSRKPTLRVVAASAAKNLDKEFAEPILARLVNSKDVGIRKTAIKSIESCGTEKLTAKLKSVYKDEAVKPLKDLTRSVLKAIDK